MLEPSLASAHANCAAARYARGEAEQAFVHLNAAIRIDRKNALFYVNRGRVYLDLGNAERAALDFKQALALRPGDPRILTLYTEAQNQAGDRSTAQPSGQSSH